MDGVATELTVLVPPSRSISLRFKLFAPRPPVPYAKPLGKQSDAPHPLQVSGVGAIFAQLKADAAAKEEKRIENGGDQDDGEDGEVKGEDAFTLCEDEKRRVRREDRVKRKEEAKKQEANCKHTHMRKRGREAVDLFRPSSSSPLPALPPLLAPVLPLRQASGR